MEDSSGPLEKRSNAGLRISFVYSLIVVCYIVVLIFILLRGSTGWGSKDFLNQLLMISCYSILLLILSLGCIRHNKFAYVASILIMFNSAGAFILRLPTELTFAKDSIIPHMLESDTSKLQASEFYALGIYCMAFVSGTLQLIAFIVLIWPSTRKEFFSKS